MVRWTQKLQKNIKTKQADMKHVLNILMVKISCLENTELNNANLILACVSTLYLTYWVKVSL